MAEAYVEELNYLVAKLSTSAARRGAYSSKDDWRLSAKIWKERKKTSANSPVKIRPLTFRNKGKRWSMPPRLFRDSSLLRSRKSRA